MRLRIWITDIRWNVDDQIAACGSYEKACERYRLPHYLKYPLILDAGTKKKNELKQKAASVVQSLYPAFEVIDARIQWKVEDMGFAKRDKSVEIEECYLRLMERKETDIATTKGHRASVTFEFFERISKKRKKWFWLHAMQVWTSVSASWYYEFHFFKYMASIGFHVMMIRDIGVQCGG